MTDYEPASISIFGLGYVGAVTAACFAQRGHRVIGVDVRSDKVELINRGKSPIVERGIEPLICQQVLAGRLSASTDPYLAVHASDVSLICVGTPSGPQGDINGRYVENVSAQIGEALRSKADYHVVVVRSTVVPGLTRNRVVPLLEGASGRSAGRDFGVCFNPEFLREASAIEDFNHPSRTVIGELDGRSGDAVVALYRDVPGPMIRTAIETGEMTKYADNAWHALKICFANEIGSLCKAVDVDGREVMDIFCQDTKLNLSPAYLKPGFAFGGSCLPKDVRALLALGRKAAVETPVLASILPSNEAHLHRALETVRRTGARSVGILGMTFKPGTDDVRESPSIQLMQKLRAEGFHVRVYDEAATLSTLTGENRRFLLERIPDFGTIAAVDGKALVDSVDVLVVTQNTGAYGDLVRDRRTGQIVIDLVRLSTAREESYSVLY